MKQLCKILAASAVLSRLLVAIALAAAGALALPACGADAAEEVPGAYTAAVPPTGSSGIEPRDTVLVVTGAQGQAFRIPDAALSYPVAAIEGELYVGAVLADGRPTLKWLRYTLGKATESGRAKELAANERDYLEYVCSLRAEDEGVDLLAGIGAAAAAIRSYGSGGGVICVVSSGITDYPATTAELLDADASSIVSQLAANGSIPDLHGMEVRFYGLGQASGGQAIPDSFGSSLRALWASIVEAGGGEAVVCRDYLEELGCDEQLPPTTAYAFPDDTITIPAGYAAKEQVVLSDAVLTFIGDEATFSDEGEALRALEAVASAVAARECVITIDGYTADSPARTREFLMDLSASRAEAVASALEALGVPRDAIASVVGHGPEGSTSMATGSFDEDQAALDRRVVITMYSDSNAESEAENTHDQ